MFAKEFKEIRLPQRKFYDFELVAYHYQKVTKIVQEYVQKEKKPVELDQYFRQYQLIYQYAYNLLFLKYVTLNKKYRVENWSNFMHCCREWVGSEKISNPPAADKLTKQSENFKNRPESSVNDCEQKPIMEREEPKFVPLLLRTEKERHQQ